MGSRPRGRERAPTPGRAGCGHSFPETRSGPATRDWLTRFGLESQTLRGWSGACCLGLPGAVKGWVSGVGSRQICGWGQELLMPARKDFLQRSMLQRDKLRPRDTEGHAQGPTAQSVGDTPKAPVLLFWPKGLPAVLHPENPQDPSNITAAGSGRREPLSHILLCHLLAVGSWSATITTLSLSVPICKSTPCRCHYNLPIKQCGCRACSRCSETLDPSSLTASTCRPPRKARVLV